MRDALRLLLQGAGFEVFSYATAEEFLADVDCPRAYCLLTDVRLPGMDGIALHRHLVSLGADPTVVMITGHGDIPMAVSALKAGVADFVEKPFDPTVLLECLRAAAQHAAASYQRKANAAEITRRLADLTPREVRDSRHVGRSAAQQSHSGKVGHQRADDRAPSCPHHGKNAGSIVFAFDSNGACDWLMTELLRRSLTTPVRDGNMEICEDCSGTVGMTFTERV